jgi:hypothetical protein
MTSISIAAISGCRIKKEVASNLKEFIISFEFKSRSAEDNLGRKPDPSNPFERVAINYYDFKTSVPFVYTITLPVRVKPVVAGKDKYVGKNELPTQFIWHLEEWGELPEATNDSDEST